MPPAAVWLPAAIGAATQLGGGIVASRAQGNATKAQMKANQEAINYEREREAKAQKQQAARDAAYRKAWNEWAARAGDEGIRRYGVPIGMTYPGAGGAPAPNPAPGKPTRIEPAPSGPVVGGGMVPGAGAQGGRIGDLIQQQGQIQANAAAGSGQIWGNALAGAGQSIAPMGQQWQNYQGAQGAGAVTVPPPDMGGGAGAGAGTIGSLSGWNSWQPYLQQGD